MGGGTDAYYSAVYEKGEKANGEKCNQTGEEVRFPAQL